jgi:hypothetical protein
MIAALDKEEADSEMAEGLETTSLESPKVWPLYHSLFII